MIKTTGILIYLGQVKLKLILIPVHCSTLLCDKVCQRHATGQLFSLGTEVSSTNKTDPHDITEILLKVALNTINNHCWSSWIYYYI